MIRYPHRNRCLTRGHQEWDRQSTREDERQRPWPKGCTQTLSKGWHLSNDSWQLGTIGEVDNQRIFGRTPLGSKNSCNGIRGEGITTQPIDGLSRKGDQFASLQQRRCNRDIGRISRKDTCQHIRSDLRSRFTAT